MTDRSSLSCNPNQGEIPKENEAIHGTDRGPCSVSILFPVHLSLCRSDENYDIPGRSMLGFSLTSPELVVCASSPEIPGVSYIDSPELMDVKEIESSVELSFENSFHESERIFSKRTPSVKFAAFSQIVEENLSPESSFELPQPPEAEDAIPKDHLPVISINAGSSNGAVTLDGVNYLKDNWYAGGSTVKSEELDFPLYQTARFGNFSYSIPGLECGSYVVDLHFAEIVFTNGPAGLRVFDVLLQEKKVYSCLDIYASVGGNMPHVISDLKTTIDGGEDLKISFEGVMGSPLLCGISIRKYFPSRSAEVESSKIIKRSQLAKSEEPKDNADFEGDEEYQMLQKRYELQNRELSEARKKMDELKKENQQKSRECQEAWKSLQELQNELMRKSMHVGSLAFAIEGQVKEKGKWFSSLRDLTRKLKIMKMEHIKLSEEVLGYKKSLTDINELASTIQTAFNQQVDVYGDLKTKFIEGIKERKELYNKILETKGNIRVFCRCRPLNTEEIANGASMSFDFESAKDGELSVKSNGVPKRIYKFDAVFGPLASQGDVFEDTAPFAISVLDGYNVCIFAYGQTGTGKTFTMEGSKDARGVNFRTLEELFSLIKEREKLYRYSVSVSVLEVYNEQIRDLLVSGGSQSGVATKRLEVRQVSEGIHHVPGLVEAPVNNMSEVWEVLQTGSNARAVSSTNANEYSSRSHCMHCVMVKGENLFNGECTSSKLWLVDLAGSERIAKAEVVGDRLKETQNINRSLSALGDVISSLATKSPHIPFRNSKLTHLLQDSLGGDSKTLMFVQISPNENDLSETLCSLNFASRVRGIELGPAKRHLDTSEFLKCKQMAERTKLDIKCKDVQIRKMEETIHGFELKVKEKDLKNKNLQDKIKELESQLLIERKLARQHVDTKIAEQQQQIKNQLEEETIGLLRPRIANRQLGGNKNIIEQLNFAKEHGSLSNPLLDNNNSFKPSCPLPPTDGFVKYIDSEEKENIPEITNRPLLPKRSGRVSICTVSRHLPSGVSLAPASVLAPRRNSLIPLPSALNFKLPPLVPLPLLEADQNEETDGSDNWPPENIPCESPKVQKYEGKNLSSILRRSLQRKIKKSPMQQHMKKGGINLGMEKVRVSIGSRARLGLAHRAFLVRGNKEAQSKQIQKEKERGWNIGNVVGRNLM